MKDHELTKVQDFEKCSVFSFISFKFEWAQSNFVNMLYLIQKLFSRILNVFQNLKADFTTSNQEIRSTKQNYTHFSIFQKQTKVTKKVFSDAIY